jgi:hypothetical protein
MLILLGGCDLEEVAVVEVENVVIAEIYVDLSSDPAENIARAFLHRTVGLEGDQLDELIDAVVTVSRVGGLTFALAPAAVDRCLESSPEPEPGACFIAEAEVAALSPGDLIEVRVDLPDGGVIGGAARLPGAFELDAVPATCWLPPNTLMDIEWSRAQSAWAYINETSIRGLPDALAGEGIFLDDDPLYLLGLSISDTDTSITFPSEFGVFNRLDLEQDVAVRLQQGLPADVTAEVTITAVDRNYVNWARGGQFNPSGQVRIPSLRGNGSGVVAATVGRRFLVISTSTPDLGTPMCPVG